MVLEETLESPLDCKEVQPVHPKGDHPECSLEGLMLKLKLQYFGHLMKVKEKSEKAGLKLNIQKTKIMASSPITSWQIDGKNGNSERLYFLGLQNQCRQ